MDCFVAAFRLLLIACFFQSQCFSVSAFLIHPQTQPWAYPSSTSSLLARADEEEWLQKKREKEEEQKEWERKIKARNDRKARGENVARPETKSNTNAKLNLKGRGKKDDKENSDKEKDDDASDCSHFVSKDAVTFAQAHSAELIALAGPKFDGDLLGVGGLDDVIAEIKRRVWTPLAAPPSVMVELGITPVRGVMLYGSSGCGKTLLARTIGKLFSPARPLTVVSGPQLMDKFVGSSEKNLRELFDNPSDVYDPYRISGGKGMDKAALHVIVLDEFDAMARTRGGPESDNSAAGVARDSVVNQILAKMDGVDPLEVPTLVIAMTNRPNLIDPALLRPGRFEVQIEVPPPRTTPARMSVLNVHMNCMQEAGRLEVKDAPKDGYVSPQCAEQASMTYEELLTYLADQCDGFSGASLAAIPRAAASRALERAVSQYSVDLNDNLQQNKGKQDAIAMFDCVVSVEDLECAVQDVRRSASITLQQTPNEITNKPQATSTNGIGIDIAVAINGSS
jgi:SpoVK/Ycf46/Vps4 family AAA+-type ATPase